MPDFDPIEEELDEQPEELEFSQPGEDAPGIAEESAPNFQNQIQNQSDFRDATPEYVTKQPDQAPDQPSTIPGNDPSVTWNDPNRVAGPTTTQPGARQSTDQLTGRITNRAAALGDTADAVGKTAQGAKQVGDAVNTAAKVSKGVETAVEGVDGTAVIEAAAKKIGGVLGDTKAGRAVTAITTDVAEIIAGFSGDITALWPVLKRHWKLIFIPAALSDLGAFVIGIAIAAAVAFLLGDAPGAIGIPGGSIYSGSSSNPQGLYLSIMRDHLDIQDPKTGKITNTLTLEATSGGYSDEDDARVATAANAAGVKTKDGRSIVGQACLYKGDAWVGGNSNAQCLAGGNIYDISTGTSTQMTDDQLKWYVTARWPYVKSNWYTDGQSASTKVVLNPAQPKKYFMGRKIVLYNPATNKAVIGMASEYGPAVWTGIAKTELSKEGTAWQYGPQGPQPRIQVPDGYTGRIAGGGSAIRDALGEGSDAPVIIGYLDPKSTLGLGPVPEGDIKVVTNSGTAAQIGKVPLIKQADYRNVPYTSSGNPKQTIASSGCGIVSSAMVMLSYGKQVTVQELAQWAVANGFRTTNSGTSYAYFPALAKREGLNSEDVTGQWAKVMTYLKAGTPIIVAGKGTGGAGSDPRPFSFGGHYVVLTGVTADGRITVNDPAGTRGGYRDNQAYSEQTIFSQYTYAVAILK